MGLKGLKNMPQSGQRVSEYVLDARIGAGAFGEVWRARHHVWSDQLAAVKLPTDPEFLRALQREGLTIQGLNHANVVRAQGFDPFAEPPYLIMEYIAGRSLREVISEGAVPPVTAVAILRQVLAGLEYAHVKGIVHRDVKPENVLVREGNEGGFPADGSVKITDFGLGQTRASAAASIALSMSVEGDRAAKLAGTLDYMSPEQRGGAALDARSDLYAVGVMLFELLTGEKPTGTELPGDLRPGVPVALNDVFRRSYTRLDRRYTSAAEMSEALARVTTKTPVEPPAVSPRNSRWPSAPPVARKDMSPSIGPACPRCRRGVGGTDQFCTHCGVQMVTNIRRCEKCGGFPDPADHYCIHCGTTLPPRLATA